MLAGTKANDFVDRLGEALESAARSGVRLTPGGSDLEWERFGAEDGEDEEARSGTLEAFEHDPVTSRNPGDPDENTRISYFLDGVQTTEEIGRIGTVPVVVTTVAAAIAHREDRRVRRLDVGDLPTVLRAIILPRNTEDPAANLLFDTVQETGMPLIETDTEGISSGAADALLDSTAYEPRVDPADYSGLKRRAYRRASALRAGLEELLLRRWSELETGDAWLAVDGGLSLPIERAVGLIKNTRRMFFGGGEARMLLDLEQGRRTTAFVPPWRAQRVHAGRPEENRASWYVRLWPADASREGTDATSGLVRVETMRGLDTGRMDELSRWILAEKAPLAKPDPRWPSMIYPILHVEKILKPLVHDGRRARLRLERKIAVLRNG